MTSRRVSPANRSASRQITPPPGESIARCSLPAGSVKRHAPRSSVRAMRSGTKRTSAPAIGKSASSTTVPVKVSASPGGVLAAGVCAASGGLASGSDAIGSCSSLGVPATSCVGSSGGRAAVGAPAEAASSRSPAVVSSNPSASTTRTATTAVHATSAAILRDMRRPLRSTRLYASRRTASALAGLRFIRAPRRTAPACPRRPSR